MNLIQPIAMDLLCRRVPEVDAVQTDSGRKIALSFFSGDVPWPVPADSAVRIRFARPDGTGGIYDTLPDGSPASQIRENTVTFVLPAQVCSCPGVTEVMVELEQDGAVLHSFSVLVRVQSVPQIGAEEGSVTLASYLPQPEAGAQVGQLLQVSAVAQDGRVTGLEAVDSAGGGSFRVHFTEDPENPDSAIGDKTYEQVLQAHQAGLVCQAVLMGALVLPLSIVFEEEGVLFFSGFYYDGVNAALYTVVMAADGTVSLDALELM